MPEHRRPVLAALAPDRLLLVGDHRQLPPFTAVRPARAARPPRSLLERVAAAVEAAGGRLPMLRTQYRMHPAVARLVSCAFYGGRLGTDPTVAAERLAASPLGWPGSWALAALDTDSEAESAGGGPSPSPGAWCGWTTTLPRPPPPPLARARGGARARARARASGGPWAGAAWR